MLLSKMSGNLLRLVHRQLPSLWEPNHLLMRFVSTQKVEPPKKPGSSYTLFSVENFGAVQRANPGLRLPELAKILGGMWRGLPPVEKEVYKTSAENQMAEYKVKRAAFLANLEPEQLSQMEKDQREKRRKLVARKKKNLCKKLGKPKRPASSGWACFVMSHKLDRGDAPLVQFVQGLAQHWNKMPVEDKAEYIEQAQGNRARYSEALQQWEIRMVEEGHKELIRGYRKPAAAKKRPKKRATKKSRKKAVSNKSKSTQTNKVKGQKETGRGKAKKKTSKATQTDPDPSWMREE